MSFSRTSSTGLWSFHRVLRRYFSSGAFALAGALAATACANDDVTSPRADARVAGAPNATYQLVGGTFSLPIPSNSAAPLLGGAPWQATGLKIIRGVNVRTRMPATMTATYNTPPPENWTCIPPYVPNGDVHPGLNPFPGQGSLGTVRYTITADALGTVGQNPTVYGSWAQVPSGGWAGVTYHGAGSPDSGYLSFRRYELDGQCNSFVKYTLFGSQTITVDYPIITVIANRSFVQQGNAVQFTTSVAGFVPVGNQWSWEWHTDSGVVPVSSCNGQSTCSYIPQRTGRMLANAFDADGLPYRGESDQVEVIRCVTGDSVLDHPVVRQALRAALDSSLQNAPLAQRRERMGYIYRDTTRALSDPLALLTWLAPLDPLNTPCTSQTNQAPQLLPNTVRVAYYHTHPFSSGTASTAADITPANCPADKQGTYFALPSDEDWDKGPTPKVPGYIIDKEQVMSYDPTDANASIKAMRNFLTKWHPWNNATCRW